MLAFISKLIIIEDERLRRNKKSEVLFPVTLNHNFENKEIDIYGK